MDRFHRWCTMSPRAWTNRHSKPFARLWLVAASFCVAAMLSRCLAGPRFKRFVFRHRLFQEVAYERQGATLRATRHAAIAYRLEVLFSSDLTLIASGLARHFVQAQLWPQAIRFLRMAARTSMRRFALREAAGMLEQAIGLSRRLPASDQGEVELSLLDEQARIYLGAFRPPGPPLLMIVFPGLRTAWAASTSRPGPCLAWAMSSVGLIGMIVWQS